MSADSARFIVGIDLGTTNSALAYIDREATGDTEARIQHFDIAQLTGPGEVSRLPVLPSFLYLPGRFDIAPEAIGMPWPRPADHFVGAFARDHGTKVPARLVSSAKSWLCHGRVDRQAPILPWGGGPDVPKISPVAATAAYLEHLKRAWNHHWADDEDLHLDHQQVVVTVPASFDQVARDLTLQAAQMAGLGGVTLLEEPLAAFYSWMVDHESDWQDHVRPGELILICDVGGGTTDFTLVTLRAAEGGPRFERIAVGDHLILGGDNIDSVLACVAARQMGRRVDTLPVDQFCALVHQCRQAKERLLEGAAANHRITVAGVGSRLIAGTLATTLTRETVEQVVLEMFFPLSGRSPVQADGPAADAPAMGLPFAEDRAITGQLLAFFERHRGAAGEFVGRTQVQPGLILFNGGSLKSELVRDRIRLTVGRHLGPEAGPRVLDNPRPDLAVAEGAAYYGWVRSGRGVRVGSGSARAYYLGVAQSASAVGARQAICLVERGLQEGSRIGLEGQGFEVRANRPVRFELFSSSFRSGDRCGDLVPVDDTLSRLPPIETVVQFGQGKAERLIPVQVEAEFTETGTLSLWCRSRATDHRWQLRFQLRDTAPAPAVPVETALDTRLIATASEAVCHAYATDDPAPSAGLAAHIAASAGMGRQQWSLGLLRSVADTLLSQAEARRRTAAHEANWLNLTGFCLRPGFGDGADAHRIKRLWRVYLQGLQFSGKPRGRSEWWILWRRVAGGLNAGQQRQFAQDLAGRLPRERIASQEPVEMWMALASMERLQVNDKVKWGRILLAALTAKKPAPQLFWALGRLGARELLYGSVDRVIAPAEAARWSARIAAGAWPNPRPAVRCMVQLARRTGDRTRDLAPEALAAARRWLGGHEEGRRQMHLLETVVPLARQEQGEIFGEALPEGLVLKDEEKLRLTSDEN